MVGHEAGSGVICVRCQAPILLKDVAKVAEEFTAQCPKCGHRHFYQIKDIKTIDRSRPR
jgi:DNA-directed RNA polymerase subunit RPC12/RpoP